MAIDRHTETIGQNIPVDDFFRAALVRTVGPNPLRKGTIEITPELWGKVIENVRVSMMEWYTEYMDKLQSSPDLISSDVYFSSTYREEGEDGISVFVRQTCPESEKSYRQRVKTSERMKAYHAKRKKEKAT